jgi:hypothetical protein
MSNNRVRKLKRLCYILPVLLLIGCGNDKDYFDITKSTKNSKNLSKPVKITNCRFINGQLRISGTCGQEGEVLLILPATKNDYRIIGSPKCKNGKYEMINSSFGRPPCEVIVEYGQGKVAKANVAGTDMYCH